MNKKGFTLVELLAVIVVLSIVMLVVADRVGDAMLKSRGNSLVLQVKSLSREVEKIGAMDNQITTNQINKIVSSGDLTYLGYIKAGNKVGDSVLENDAIVLQAKKGSKFSNISFTNDVKDLGTLVSSYSNGSITKGDINLKNNKDWLRQPIIYFETTVPIFDNTGHNISTIFQNNKSIIKNEIRNKLVYFGPDPNNYIKIGNDVFRIISYDTDLKRLKLIDYNSNIKIAWDIAGKRYNSNNSFCTNSSLQPYNRDCGCNVFKSIDNELIRRVQHNNVLVKGTVKENSNIYLYLNNDYLKKIQNNNLLSNILLKNQKFYTGMIKYNNGNSTINDIISYEESETSYSDIGLINVSDYLYASNLCNGSKKYLGYNTSCGSNNWLYNKDNQWTINADDGNTWFIWGTKLDRTGELHGQPAANKLLIKPVFYVKDNIKIISGKGTKDNPYIINEY